MGHPGLSGHSSCTPGNYVDVYCEFSSDQQHSLPIVPGYNFFLNNLNKQ